MIKTVVATIALATVAASASAADVKNVTKPVSADRYTSRFETGVSATADAAREAAAKRAEQELRGVVQSDEKNDKVAGGWRWKRFGSNEEMELAGGWRWKRVGSNEELKLAGGWRWHR